MWIITDIGFFSVVSYDEVRDPSTKPAEKDKYYKTWESQKDGKTYGYYDYPSFVRPRRNPKVMVRARVRKDLQRLIALAEKIGLPKPELCEWKHRDYPYRIVILQRDWARLARQLATDINYTNFKNHISATDPDGTERSHIYSSIWTTLNGLERKLNEAKNRARAMIQYPLQYGGKGRGKNGGGGTTTATFPDRRKQRSKGSDHTVDYFGLDDPNEEEGVAVGISIVSAEDWSYEDLQAAAKTCCDEFGQEDWTRIFDEEEEAGILLTEAAYPSKHSVPLSEWPQDDLSTLADYLFLAGYLTFDSKGSPRDPFYADDNPSQEALEALLPAELRK